MIGIFDSGIGGLTVLKKIRQVLPNEKLIYFGDTARVPWGNKSTQTVRYYAEEICDFLIAKKCRKIVIACNTASAVASDYLKKKFKKIEFCDVITPAAKKLISIKKKGTKVGIIGTRATIGSGIYQKKIKQLGNGLKIFAKPCPLFVPLIEEGWINKKTTDSVIDEYLSEFKQKKINWLVLGCTHYPLLKNRIKKYFDNRIEIVSSADEVAKELKLSCNEEPGLKQKAEFYFSDWNKNYESLARRILNDKKFKARAVKLLN